MQKIRVVIVDDDPLVRVALVRFVTRDPDIEVVAEAGSGPAALEAVARHLPDIVMIDVQMPHMDGIETTAAITASRPDVRVLAVSIFDTTEKILQMLRAGASGYLLKDSSADEIVAGLRQVHGGTSSLSPRIASRLIEHVRESKPRTSTRPADLDALTEREHDVLAHLARGMSNAEIAGALFVSEGTIKANLGRIMTKWQVRDRVQLLITAARAGLVDFR